MDFKITLRFKTDNPKYQLIEGEGIGVLATKNISIPDDMLDSRILVAMILGKAKSDIMDELIEVIITHETTRTA